MEVEEGNVDGKLTKTNNVKATEKKGVVKDGFSKTFSPMKTCSSKKLLEKEDIGSPSMKNVVDGPRELRG